MPINNSRLGKGRIRKITDKPNAHIHFIGIGGAGMTPLAMLLRRQGRTVTGSDTADISGLPLTVSRGHSAENVRGCDLVVYTLAISDSNPELCEALRLGIPVCSRAELLGAVMSGYGESVAVAGTHGKSTTTAMLDLIFERAGLSPTTVSGATLSDGEPVHIGGGMLIAEACEYRDSFLSLAPRYAAITNIELEHTDYFKSEEQLLSSFLSFARGAESAIVGVDMPLGERLFSELDNAVSVGKYEWCDYRIDGVEDTHAGVRLSLTRKGEPLMDLHLSVYGEANATDAAIAAAVAHIMGIPVSTICDSLHSFSGIARRMELLSQYRQRQIYYDYAHHPTEIVNTIRTLKHRHGKCTVVFRPHTYSRTASLMREFCQALSLADYSVILDVYAAREAAIRGADAETLASLIGENSIYLDFKEVVPYLFSSTEGAIVLMGAGDMTEILKDIRGLV